MSNLGNKEIFSENLQYYVGISGKNQREIAEDLGVPYTTFNDWYIGKKYPRIDKIEMMANYFGILKSDLIEDRASKAERIAEMKKKNDIMTDIVVRMRMDNDFRSLVEHLSTLDADKIKSVKNMLNTFLK